MIEFDKGYAPFTGRVEVEIGAGTFELAIKSPDFGFLRKEAVTFGVEKCDLLMSLILDWDGVEHQGEKVEFNQQNFERFCLQFPAVYKAIIFALQDHLTRHRLTEAETKN